jgi:hypothetical protein
MRWLVLPSTATLGVLLLTAPALAKKPAPCPDGQYGVQGQPLIAGGKSIADDSDGIVVRGRSISIASGCALTRGKVTATKKGTMVRGRWQTCGSFRKVSLKARISLDCKTITGTLTAKKTAAATAGVWTSAAGGCPSGYVCLTVNGVLLICALPGTGCGGDNECCSRACTAGTCCGLGGPGQRCQADANCCSGACFGGSCCNLPGQGCLDFSNLKGEADLCCSGDCHQDACTSIDVTQRCSDDRVCSTGKCGAGGTCCVPPGGVPPGGVCIGPACCSGSCATPQACN